MKLVLMIKAIFLFLFIFMISLSCSDEKDTEPDPIDELEELKPEFDISNYGSYKGVIIGSSGTVRFFIAKDYVKAYLEVDGLKDTLTTPNTFPDKQKILNATFAGKKSTMKFSVDADGTNPTLADITIEGHDVVLGVIAKETTAMEVRCFEGTFVETTEGVDELDEGTFNCIIFGNSLIGIFKSTIYEVTGEVNGSVSNGEINADGTQGTTSSGATFEGSLDGDICSGTWENIIEVDGTTFTLVGTWAGERTL